MEVDCDGDEEVLASKAFMDNTDAEAHASVILATDFDQARQTEGMVLTNANALRNMTLSEAGISESWEHVDRGQRTGEW